MLLTLHTGLYVMYLAMENICTNLSATAAHSMIRYSRTLAGTIWSQYPSRRQLGLGFPKRAWFSSTHYSIFIICCLLVCYNRHLHRPGSFKCYSYPTSLIM